MNLPRKLSFALFLVASAITTMNAGILLTGNTAGFFQPVSGPNMTVTNTADKMNASFRTGIPLGNSFKSGVKFSGHEFENVGNGDTISLGLLTYINGVSRIGTSSGTALLDLYLNFEDPTVGLVYLTTITFGIDATINTRANMSPDVFTASFSQPAPIWLNGEWVQFAINGLPKSTLVAENAMTNLASISLTVIPEASHYAAILGFASMGFALFYRRRIFPANAG